MEASLTGSQIDAKNPEVSAVAVDLNTYEDIKSGYNPSKINKFSNDMEIDIKE